MKTENNKEVAVVPAPLSPRHQMDQRKSGSDPLPSERNWLNLSGTLKTTTTIPTQAPKSMSDSVVIYIDDLTTPVVKRLYVYSREAGIWNYITLF